MGIAARHRLAIGLFANDLRAQQMAGQEALVDLRTIGDVGPLPAVLLWSISSGSSAPSLARRVGDPPAAD
jgi:hypothetical protein